MSESNGSERRNSPRYPVSQVGTVPVLVERHDSVPAEEAQLVDLSEQGLKLITKSSLQFAERVLLRIALIELDVSLNIRSTIVWNRATSEGTWMVGCSFDEVIPKATVDRLAKAGLIERRVAARIFTNVPGIARRQLSAETSSITVTDYSAGGFCMKSDVCEDVGTKVRVQFESGETVFGVIKWNLKEGSEFLHGCEFLSTSLQQNQGALILATLSAPDGMRSELIRNSLGSD